MSKEHSHDEINNQIYCIDHPNNTSITSMGRPPTGQIQIYKPLRKLQKNVNKN